MSTASAGTRHGSKVSESVAYTNHTVMSEALEKWPQDLVQTLLPRVWEILCEINRRWCEYLVSKFGSSEKVGKTSSSATDRCTWQTSAFAACYKINGVSGLHGEILKKKDLFKDICGLRPEIHLRHKRHRPPPLACSGKSAPARLVSELLEGDEYLTEPEKLIGLLVCRQKRGAAPRKRDKAPQQVRFCKVFS